ncbi:MULTISPECIES: hypothetical protein [Streptomyces]|uniref:hypothetical protein n=1 Tax=Streptomyces TaxID=1883 RepID=UPI000A38F795|nr:MULTISPECIES: hypothetical protein [Streptomyces]MDN5383482.1 hypothetical protein [Streptomyces sp. LB8]
MGGDPVENGRSVPCGSGQVGRLDNDTVLCDTKHTYEQRFGVLDIASEAKPVPVVPGNDHRNYGMVVSPDGQKFAFLSPKGTASDYFLCGTEPGSTPKKIQRTGESATLGDFAVFIEWR